jgi:hypothetical protein
MSGFLCSMVGATFTVAATAQVLRSAIGITAQGNAQISTAQSKFGGASALFDGTGDNLLIPSNSIFTMGTANYTLEMWFRVGSTASNNLLFDFRSDGSDSQAPLLYVNDTGRLSLYSVPSGVIESSAGAVTTNTWHHVAVVRNGSTTSLYLNGTSVASTTATMNWTSNRSLLVGMQVGTTSSINGYIDELRISDNARYTTTFTSPTTAFVNDSNTLLLLHCNGTNASTVFTDDNGIRAQNGISAIGNAQISTAQSKFGGASALFDGTGDSLTVSPTTGLADLMNNDFTIEFWMYNPETGIDATFGDHFIGIENGGSGSNGWIIRNLGSKLQWIFDGQGGYDVATFNPSANTWHHIAFVRSGTTLKCYTDGTERTVTSYADRRSNSGSYNIKIGKVYSSLSDDYLGHLDEIRISNSARYTTTFTPSTTAFVNDSNTLLLIHADGTDASTAFTDDNSQLTVTPAAASVNEGSSLTFNVNTVNTADQTLYYSLTNSGDFATSTGSFSLTSNAGSFSVTPTADTTTEGAETFTASVRTGSTSGTIIATSSSVTINDTSLTPSAPATAFDGTGDYFEGTAASSSGVADSVYLTLAGLVFKTTSDGPLNMLQIQLGTASGNAGFQLGHWPDGQIHLRQPDNSGADNSVVFGTSGSVGSWMQFVLYVDYSNFANCKYYVNGVDQTANLLNGASVGERSVDGQAMNWTSSTTVKINIGGFFAYNGVNDLSDYNGKIQYLLAKAGAGAPTISNYWDSATSKPKNLGTNGNATGIAPHVYHYGDTTTFAVNNASNPFATYTLTKFGGASDTTGTPYA